MARKTKQEAQETRNRLLDAAELLFLEHGVARTSLQDIASAAGVTRGAVYWHFEDKVQLFHAMMDRATMPLECGMQQNTSGAGALSLSELRWVLLNVMHATMYNDRTRRAFEIAMMKVEYTGELMALHERKLEAHRSWRELNQACFDAAVAAGQLPIDLDTHQAALALVALVDGLIHQWMMAPSSFDLLKLGAIIH